MICFVKGSFTHEILLMVKLQSMDNMQNEINKSSRNDIISFSNLHYGSVTITSKYVQKLVLFVIYIRWPSFCIRLIRIPRRDILIKGLLAKWMHSISHIYRGIPSIINTGTHVSFLDRRDEVYRFTWQMFAYIRIPSILTIENLYIDQFLDIHKSLDVL